MPTLLKLKGDSVLRIIGGSKVEAFDTYKFFQVRRMCNIGGEASVIIGSHPKFPMTVRSQCRQEERIDMENRSQASDLSAGSDHHWIEENLHVL
jgi:hypothetical protein